MWKESVLLLWWGLSKNTTVWIKEQSEEFMKAKQKDENGASQSWAEKFTHVSVNRWAEITGKIPKQMWLYFEK